MKQLDSLRAIAVLMVLYTHFYAGKTPPASFFRNTIEWGGIGVGLFFVLSGFLISNILLKNKMSIEEGSESIASCMKTFYFRRTLRIFPIYYISIFALFLIDLKPVRETIWWLVSYTSNIYFSEIGRFDGCISHLWSLSIEEQFYLIWPCIILLTPTKHLLSVILCIIASSPLFAHFCSLGKVNHIAIGTLPFNHLCKFGFGALLAYLRVYRLENEITAKAFRVAFYVSGALFIESLVLYGLQLPNTFGHLFQTISAVFYMCIIEKLSRGLSGLPGKFLELKPLVFIGKISYGIYLYHFFIMYLMPSFFKRFTGGISLNIELQALLYTVITLGVASASWYLIEKPILALKDRVDFSKCKVAGALEVTPN